MGSVTADQFDASLRAAFDEPQELPPAEAWLAEPRHGPTQAQYAYLILRKHFAHYWRDRDDARRADEGYY